MAEWVLEGVQYLCPPCEFKQFPKGRWVKGRGWLSVRKITYAEFDAYGPLPAETDLCRRRCSMCKREYDE